MTKTFIPAGVRSYGDYSAEAIRLVRCEPYHGKRRTLPPLQHVPIIGKMKTVLCRYWLDGACVRGTSCTFAHGQHEIGGVRMKMVLRPTRVDTPVTCLVPTSVMNAMRRKRRRISK